MRKMSRQMMQVGLAAAYSVLLPWLACAQEQAAGEADAAAPKAEVRRKPPAKFFGVEMKAGDKDAPQRETEITAKKIDFDKKEGIILFDGNVVVDDAQFIMHADRLIVFLEKETDDVSQILAMGNVDIKNELRHAICVKAVYTKKDAQIVMTADEEDENSVVHLETNAETAGTVKGYKVVIWLDDERVQVLPREGATEQPRIKIPALGKLNRAGDEEKKLP